MVFFVVLLLLFCLLVLAVVGGTCNGDLVVGGNIQCTGGVNQSGQTITPANLTLGPFSAHYHQDGGTAIVAATSVIHLVGGTKATLIRFQAAITGVIPTGGNTVNVDLQRSTGGGAFASVLAATIPFGSTDALRTLKSATFSTTGCIAGDLLQVVITVTGSSAQGVIVTLDLQQSP